MQFYKLLQPMKIKNLELRNRIVMPAMHLGFAENGFVGERLIKFYEERAKGEVGLIVVGGCAVDKLSGGLPNFIWIDEDKYIEKLSELTKRVHNFGAKISCQLYHAGRYAFSVITGSQSLSASAVPSKFTGEIPKEMTVEEIKKTIENIASAARRAKEAKFDAVELLGSAGYIINQFLSPLTNKREDEYGGSFEKRLKFPLELIKRVRKEIGEDSVLMMRMSGDDFIEGSNTFEENKLIAKEYEKAGVDIISVTGGWHETKVPQISMFVPRGAFVYLAHNIKKEVNIPVISANRINNPLLAEEILISKKADLIAMGRALIADPELPKKTKEGKLEDIRPCIACNQGCFDKVFEVSPICCLTNALAGREHQIKIERTPNPKKIMIIGAGPAGLEAARVLSLRGHKVSIYEKENKIGGQLNLAGVCKGREEFNALIEYFSNQIKNLSIHLELNKEVNINLIKEVKPDIVILSSGAKQIIPKIKGIENKKVVYAYDVLSGEKEVDEKVVIIGGGGVGVEVALHLAKKRSINNDTAMFLLNNKAISFEKLNKFKGGEKIVILEMLDKIGKDIGRSTRWTFLSELREQGVKMFTNTKVEEITDTGVKIKNGEEKFFEADTVIIAVGTEKEDSLFEDIKNLNIEVYKIGDCKNPRKALDAIHEGFEVGVLC